MLVFFVNFSTLFLLVVSVAVKSKPFTWMMMVRLLPVLMLDKETLLPGKATGAPFDVIEAICRNCGKARLRVLKVEIFFLISSEKLMVRVNWELASACCISRISEGTLEYL